MSAAGLYADVEQRKLSERGGDAVTNFKARHRRTASAAARCHSGASHCVAADLAFDSPSILGQPAVHQSYITLFHLSARELLRQLAMGHIVLRNNNQPAGFPIETMNDPR